MCVVSWYVYDIGASLKKMEPGGRDQMWRGYKEARFGMGQWGVNIGEFIKGEDRRVVCIIEKYILELKQTSIKVKN